MRKLAVSIVAARLAQARGRHRLLEGQRPAVERARAPGRRVVRDGQHPGPLHAHAIGRGCEGGGQRLLRVERGEERRLPSWIGVAALSSKTVLSKLAVVLPMPPRR